MAWSNGLVTANVLSLSNGNIRVQLLLNEVPKNSSGLGSFDLELGIASPDLSFIPKSFTAIDGLTALANPVDQSTVLIAGYALPSIRQFSKPFIVFDIAGAANSGGYSLLLDSMRVNGSSVDAIGMSIYFNRAAGILIGSSAADLMFGSSGTDSLRAGAGDDTLQGAGGSDSLNGGSGADTMLGGAGNDTYIVDNAGDRVFETTTAASSIDAGGTDTVLSSVTFNLNANSGVRFVERLTLTGSGNINGTGNALNNVIKGNVGNNRLDGGTGRDSMFGGAGNDTYIVDNVGDRVFETTTAASSINAGGTDTVLSSVTFNLNANAGVRFVEKLTLTGSGNINGTGNALANTITGNDANNTITGFDGNDILQGGAGDDTINGGLGRDRMTGGTGADVFVFRSIGESGTTTATRDVITDFGSGVDVIDLQAIDADSTRTNNQAFSFIGDVAFTGRAGELRFANSILSADVNGDKRADFQVQFSGVGGLTETEMIL